MSAKQTPESFWARVDVRDLDDCWPWQGSTNNFGYGTVTWHGRCYVAHRVAGWLVGVVPEAAAPADKTSAGFLLHSCDNPPCCNPTHWEPGTFSTNQQHAYARKRRAQPKGAAHANAKLTVSEAHEIRVKYARGGVRQADLADHYGVSQRAVSLVVRGETY